MKVTSQWLDQIKANLCELPITRQLRFVDEYKLSDYDASVLTAERQTADFFDSVITAGGEPKRVCNLLTQVGLKLANEKSCSVAQLNIEPAQLAKLSKMAESGIVSATAANSIFEQMAQTGNDPEQIAQQQNLIQKSDAGELESFVDEVIAANPQAVADVKSGGKKSQKAMGFLLGQVMQKSRGQANPKVVSQIFAKKLS